MSEVVDGTAEETTEQTAEPGEQTALAVIDAHAGAVVSGDRPADIIAHATEVANALKQLIEQQNLAKNLGGQRKHVEVGGWQALGAMLGALGGQPLHAETVWTRKVLDGQPPGGEHGSDWEACVEIRTPAGVVVGRAEAMCSRQERTWARRDDYAVRSMAETRAESRAFRRAVGWIVNIAGYNPTPAEEMGHNPGQDDAPRHGVVASPGTVKTAKIAMVSLAGGDKDLAAECWSQIAGELGGVMPEAAAVAVIVVSSLFAPPAVNDDEVRDD